MCNCVLDLIEGSIKAFESQTLTLEEATRLNTLETSVDTLKDEYETKHIERLSNNGCETRSGIMFVNTLVDFERVGDHAINIAWSVGKKPHEKVDVDRSVINSAVANV